MYFWPPHLVTKGASSMYYFLAFGAGMAWACLFMYVGFSLGESYEKRRNEGNKE